jgi:hypothetical protein
MGRFIIKSTFVFIIISLIYILPVGSQNIITWTGYVFRYSIDGFRLDINIHRPDLWRRIKEIIAKKGYPIVVFDETNGPFKEGALGENIAPGQ